VLIGSGEKLTIAVEIALPGSSVFMNDGCLGCRLFVSRHLI
jgi:hypothetical protein